MAGDVSKGMRLNVSRTTLGDCTLRGISSTHDVLHLVGVIDARKPEVFRASRPPVEPMPEDCRVFEVPDDGAPVAILVRNLGGPVVCLVPVAWDEAAGAYRQKYPHSMHGGNHADTGDSRVSDLLTRITGQPWYAALNVHDRVES